MYPKSGKFNKFVQQICKPNYTELSRIVHWKTIFQNKFYKFLYWNMDRNKYEKYMIITSILFALWNEFVRLLIYHEFMLFIHWWNVLDILINIFFIKTFLKIFINHKHSSLKHLFLAWSYLSYKINRSGSHNICLYHKIKMLINVSYLHFINRISKYFHTDQLFIFNTHNSQLAMIMLKSVSSAYQYFTLFCNIKQS